MSRVSPVLTLPCLSPLLAETVGVSCFESGLVTGKSSDGAGGTIELVAGDSAETRTYSRRRLEGVDGPHVQLKAGDATSAKSTGGNVMLFAGHGTSNDKGDGGDGGSIEMIAGGGHGRNARTDTGGDVSMSGG